MKKHFFRSNVVYNQPNVQIDRESGLIQNVVIANYGKNKNGTFFSDRFLNELLVYGNNEKNGIKARFGHPNMCSTSLGSFIGRYKNFRIEDRKLYGDLQLDEISKKTKVEGRDISMFDWVFDMAENNSDVFGNSIHIMADDVDEVIQENGKNVKYAGHLLQQWVASDIVDDPAATENLFYGVTDLGVAFTQFLDENPELFEAIDQKPEVIIDFFERYENYSKRKFNNQNKVSVFEKIRKAFGQSYDISLTLANGDIVTVITDAEQPAVGDQVKDANGNAIADGEHLLPDGKSLVTVNGEITEIKEAAPSETETEPTLSEVMNSVKALSTKFDTLIAENKAFKKYQKESTEGVESLFEKIQDLDKKFQTLAKGVGSNYETTEDTPEGSTNQPVAEKYATAKSLKARQEELKNKK